VRRARALAAAVALGLSLAAGAATDSPTLRAMRAWIAEHHANPADYDEARIAREIAEGAPAHESPDAFSERVANAMQATFQSFAPFGAVPDPSVRYRLPFALDVPRYLVQGNDGKLTHQGVERFAFDFAMPVGSQVLAARDGVAARVTDGFEEGGFDPKFADKANTVLVLHADGTFAAYTHLRAGIAVKEGQSVKRGDPIGWSGQTGFAAGPHLHFSVYRRIPMAPFVESVPIRFGVGKPEGFVPTEGEFYGGQPRQSVEMRITADGQPCDDAHPLRLARGASARLGVTIVGPGGAPLDVTRAAQTRFLAPTAWSVVVDDHGVVTASPTPDFAAALLRLPAAQRPAHSTDWGIVIVSHEDAARGRYGFASVPVLIREAKR